MNNNINEINEININKKAKRIRRKYNKLVFIIGLTAVVCVVSTYAWFIGINTVSVNSIELSVRVSEGLLISTTAHSNDSFSNQITLDLESLAGSSLTNYQENKNSLPGTGGLKPFSSIGKMDAANSVLELYSKTSMTSTAGGYRLRANKIDNTTSELPGYLAFDLFFKNVSGNTYNSDYDPTADEGIYLNASSSVSISTSGSGGDGMQNAIRIAFMQIGRVAHNSGVGSNAQGITCSNDVEHGVTGLCNLGADGTHALGRGITFNIWEPNDTAHTQASLDHFRLICKSRSEASTYTSNTCGNFDSTNVYVPTYAINDNITSADNVDIYDGLNGYASVSEKLTRMTYYKDTDKLLGEDSKTEFFFLAPNSITKVRVYVYLEGQDVDNYDLTSYGKTIKINFSFSKSKASDIQEPGPEENVGDGEEEAA